MPRHLQRAIEVGKRELRPILASVQTLKSAWPHRFGTTPAPVQQAHSLFLMYSITTYPINAEITAIKRVGPVNISFNADAKEPRHDKLTCSTVPAYTTADCRAFRHPLTTAANRASRLSGRPVSTHAEPIKWITLKSVRLF